MTDADSSGESQQTKASDILERSDSPPGLLSLVWGTIVSFGGLALVGTPFTYLLFGWGMVEELWLAVVWMVVGFTTIFVAAKIIWRVRNYAA